MAVTQEVKIRRMARWERKQKQYEKDKLIRKVLEDRKRQRKCEQGVEQILRYAPNKQSGRRYTDAAGRLWDIARRLKLVKSEHMTRPGYIGRNNPYLFAMSRMIGRCDRWVRDPAGFITRTHNTERQFTELLRYLFTHFEPPQFLEQAWFEPDDRKACRFQTWYILLGQGQSPRRLSGLPIELTSRAAHLLVDVPVTLTVECGLRWAQVRAMGASPTMADAILASPIGTDFERDAFWLTVVRFLVDQPMLDPNQVGPIVDYIHHQRHEPQFGGDGGPAQAQPPQPNYAMKGRSIDRLLRQVEQWHGRITREVHGQRFMRWKSSGICGRQWTEGVGKSHKRLVIRELLDSSALANEGARMHHCVGSYAQSCSSGRAAIFTMTRLESGTIHTLLTIEIRPQTRTIVQARGKCNAKPTPDELRMLRGWAQQAGLQLSDWL